MRWTSQRIPLYCRPGKISPDIWEREYAPCSAGSVTWDFRFAVRSALRRKVQWFFAAGKWMPGWQRDSRLVPSRRMGMRVIGAPARNVPPSRRASGEPENCGPSINS
jgi:hypothetical protein